MGDQAQGLRELVAGDGRQDMPRVGRIVQLTNEPAKVGSFPMVVDKRMPKGVAVMVNPSTDPLDYRRLWLDLKAELLAEGEGKMAYDYAWIGPGKDPARSWPRGFEGGEEARRFLDRMEQAETFARARAEFKSTEGGS